MFFSPLIWGYWFSRRKYYEKSATVKDNETQIVKENYNPRIDKWDYMKLESSSTAEDMVREVTRQHAEWEEICASCTSENSYLEYIRTRIIKENKTANQ